MPYTVRQSGFQRSYVGEIGAVAGVSLPITETWTHADATDNLDADFDWVSLVAGWDIVSNKSSLTNSGGATRIERMNVDLQTNDFRVRAPVVTFPTDRAGTQVIGVCCRMQGDNSLTFYTAALLCVAAGPVSLFLARWVAGIATTLGPSLTLPSLSLPSDLAVSARGNVISAWWAGSRRLAVVDPTPIPAGGYGGIQGVAQGATNTVEFSQATFEAVPSAVVPLDLLGRMSFSGVR
jgi:hypothetical protein